MHLVIVVRRHNGDIIEFPDILKDTKQYEKYMIKKDENESVVGVFNKLRQQTDINLDGLMYAEYELVKDELRKLYIGLNVDDTKISSQCSVICVQSMYVDKIEPINPRGEWEGLGKYYDRIYEDILKCKSLQMCGLGKDEIIIALNLYEPTCGEERKILMENYSDIKVKCQWIITSELIDC